MKNNILITLLFVLILNGCNFITPQNNEKNNKDTLFIEKDAPIWRKFIYLRTLFSIPNLN